MLNSVAASVMQKVFPEGTALGTNGGSSGSRFWMIPGKEGEPRWILPDEQKHALPFLQQWRPYDFRSRIKWLGLMAAYRGKKLHWVPGVVPLRINVPQNKNWDHLGWSHIDPPVPVIYIGSPGPTRKVVFGLTDSQKSQVTSICKAPLGAEADASINQETDILEKLAQEKPGLAPRSLFTNRSSGIAAQEFIAGDPSGRQLTKNHLTCLVDLAIPGETTSLREVLEELKPRIQGLENLSQESRSILDRALSEIDDPTPLPAVWEHGDFVPWNIKTMTDGSLRAVDWEAASRKGLPLFDIVFFRSMQAFLFGEKELFPKPFRGHLLQYCKQLEIPQVMIGKIIRACLLRDWLRFHESNFFWDRAAFLLRTLAKPPGELI